MAIDVRTIQMRRGLAVDFNPAKMVPGEWAVSQDNEKLYMCFTAGRVVEIGTTSSIIHYVEDAEAWARGTRDGVPVDNSQPQYENNSKYYAEIEAVAEVRNAEAWARGTRNNVNVPDTDPAYHNNSKYYAEVEAVEEVQNAEAWAVGQRAGTDVPSTDPNYHNNSKYYSEQSDASAIASAVSASNAATSEDNSEAWARGTKNGTDVPNTDPQYHNNSKYYAEVVAVEETQNAEAWARGSRGGTNVPSTDPAYNNNSKYYSEVADSRADDAEDHKENSEAWAVGTKNGVPVSSSDPQYHNSAKDWAEVAEAVVGIGIATTERAGIVKPDGETILVEPDGKILAPNVNSATEDFIEDTVGWTGKNLIPFPYRDNASKVVNGVTFTLNDDGSVTVQTVETGATADSNFAMRWRSDTPAPYIPLGNYYISGCPDGGSTSTYYIEFNCTYNGAVRSYGKLTDSASVLITRASGETGLGCGITIKSGCIITTPIIFKPMLRLASINDATYEPYHKPVSEWGYTRSEASILGAKNLIPYPYSNTTKTENGVTFTDNGDGTVLINIPQTATNKANFWCYSFNIDYMNLSNGTYIISKSGHSDIACSVAYYLNSTWKKQINATENDETFVINKSDTSYNNIGVVIYVPANTTSVSNLLIKPMIRLASDPDDTWQPYAETNYQLTHNKMSYEDNGVLGAKNLIPIKYLDNSGTKQGITYTVNADMSIKANGTASASHSFNINHPSEIETLVKLDKNKKYIFSDSMRVDVKSNYALGVRYYAEGVTPSTSTGTNVSLNADNNYQVEITNAVYAYIYIYVWSGKTLNNVTFKPLLRLASDKDNTYYPPAMTNKQLTDNKFSYKDNGVLGAKNLIPYPYQKLSDSNRGIDFTFNSDGSVGFSGTPNNVNSPYSRLTNFGKFLLKAGTYKLTDGSSQYGGIVFFFYNDANETTNYSGTYSGLIKNSSNQILLFTTSNGNQGTSTNLFGYEKTFTIGSDAYINVQARTVNNTVSTSISGTIYPMLRLATDADGTYQPYAETNYKLTHNKMSYEDNGVLGAKNLLRYPYYQASKTQNNVTFTNNGDGTVTINTGEGGATDSTRFYFVAVNTGYNLPNGRYILSCGWDNTSGSIDVRVALNNGSTYQTEYTTNGGEVTFVLGTSPTRTNLAVYIKVAQGATADNIVCKPMLRLASDPDDTWQPYAMTNKALTDANKELTDGKVSKTGDTITGTLILSRTTDASGTVNNKPALIVGGTDTQPHIEIDSNEIMAKADGTTTGELYLNSDGGLVKINGKIAGKFTSTPTDKYVLVADGTEGNIKSISTLPVAQGGTGDTTITANGVMVGNGTSGVKTANSQSGALYSTGDGVMPLFGALPVPQGGTGHGSAGITANAVLLGNGTSAFKTIATGSGALYATAANAQPVFGILPVAQGGTGGSTAAAARSGLDVYSKGEVNTNINNLNTAINGKASLAGAKFTGNVDTNGYLYVSNGTTSVGFHSGTHNSTQCVNTTAPIQSNYGALVLASLGSTHVVSIRGKETHIRNNADSAYVKIYASAFDTSSSRRYKENIQDLSDEEAKKLLDVNVVTFDFKKDVGIAEDNDRLNKFGVIAEDVVEICPDVVSFREIDGEMLPDSVDYSKFVPRLIKMIQIQEERINELERRINNEL